MADMDIGLGTGMAVWVSVLLVVWSLMTAWRVVSARLTPVLISDRRSVRVWLGL